jgi:hypothetical protein
MWVAAVLVMGGLLFFAGLSVYSALMLSKQTDNIVTQREEADETPAPLTVRFPKEVFRPTRARE